MPIDPDIAKKYRNTRVLITGGLGFIGSNIARQLLQMGAEVTVVDSLIPEYGGNLHNVADIEDQLEISFSDVRDTQAMDHHIKGKDYLFSLAGQTSHIDSMNDPVTDMEINARAQLSILEACRKSNPGIWTLFASTRQLYGKPSYLPVDETHPINPVDVNGINKLAGEMYYRLYSDVYDMHTVCIRMTNTYGPAMRVKDARQTFLGSWIRQALCGELVQVYGDGRQLRDFNYVDDVVRAMLITAGNDRCRGRIYNLGSEEVINLSDLAHLVIQQAKSGNAQYIDFPTDRKKIDIGDYYADYTSITRDTGWSPRVNIEDGLHTTLSYYREYGKHYWE